MNTNISPVIIIGAPRSGTNMLRNVLTRLPSIGTWPCDEINYIWRHGNVRYRSDEFTANMATPSIQRYIRNQFGKLAKRHRFNTVVEKTCANSLRVGFIDRVLPEARYIYIVRDGIDTVASARKRWKATLDLPYILKKARYVPLLDLPYYATTYLANRIYRLLSNEKRLAFWGPKLDNMDFLLANHSLEEVCAIQWRRCVDSAEQNFSTMAPEKVVRVRYEDFVTQPGAELARICNFLGLDITAVDQKLALEGVSTKSVGKGSAELGSDLVHRITPYIEPHQSAHFGES
jgi:hypothetical protein